MPISKIKGNAIEDDAITSARLDDGTIVAVDLASEAVNTSKMSGLTSSSSGFIKADGDGTMSVATADLVDDTTPQLGGDLDGNGNTIDLSGNTEGLTLPQGTTAQEPTAADYTGAVRYDTDRGVLTYSNGTTWFKVSAELAVLDSVSGNIYAGVVGSGLTLTGSGFLTDDITVNFTQSSDGIDEDVVVTASSDTSATVSVPANVYNNVTAGNAVTITVTNADGSTSSGVNKTAVALPSGGSITTSGNYRIHTFTSSSTFTNTISNLSTEYLVIAGGGGGGRGTNAAYIEGGGGGGAGGYLTGTTTASATTHTITVGAGGSGSSSDGSSGSQGSSSSALSISTVGGGYGAGGSNSNLQGGSGGSGGGSGARPPGTTAGGSATSGQGFAGGAGNESAQSGGGGGAGGAGAGAAGYVTGGAGGAGASSSITGSAVTRAGGGGGGSFNSGAGGSGGGGAGSSNTVNGVTGSTNTGSGGGGAFTGMSTGSGGSGIVILRYDTTAI